MIGEVLLTINKLGFMWATHEETYPPFLSTIDVYTKSGELVFNMRIPTEKAISLYCANALERYILFHFERTTERARKRDGILPGNRRGNLDPDRNQ